MCAQIHPAQQNPQRVNHYTPYENEINVNGIVFPTKVSAVDRFEVINENRYSVNIFGYEDEKYFLSD